MSIINKSLQSMPGQFVIGGLTVSGISFFANSLNNPLLGGIIASIPIGMPSTIFVKDASVQSYTWNLLVMSSVLLLATFINWVLINKVKYDKYLSVFISMMVWAVIGGAYYVSVR